MPAEVGAPPLGPLQTMLDSSSASVRMKVSQSGKRREGGEEKVLF